MLLLLVSFLSVSKGYMPHLSLSTCKGTFADLANVGRLVDCNGGIACNSSVRRESSVHYDIIEAAVAAICNDRWFLEDLSTSLAGIKNGFQCMKCLLDVREHGVVCC